jgi:endo-1,4-beta-xylanase
LNDFPVKGRTDPALLFDKRLQAKPAYTALVNPDSLPVYRQQMDASKGTPVLGSSIDKIWDTIKWQM